ncbi:MAG: PAS domain S-box protein [Thermoguttaceae bacterium]
MGSDEARTILRLRGSWSRSWQYGVAAFVLLVGLTASAAVFFGLRLRELEQVRKEFGDCCNDHVAAIQKMLDLAIAEVRSLESLYASSSNIDRQQFKTFVSRLGTRPSVRALQWAPRVPASTLAEFEKARAHEGFPDFRITQYDDGGRASPARGRDAYFPIVFVEPTSANVAAIGFDLGSDPVCRATMRRACDTGRQTVTPTIRLPNESSEQLGMRLFAPVYRGGHEAKSVRLRREHLAGFVVGVLRLSGIVEESFAGFVAAGIDIHLFDTTDPSQPQLLYESRPDIHVAPGEETGAQLAGFRYRRAINAAGRRWTVVATMPSETIDGNLSWYPWIAAAACFLLIAMLAAYLAGMAKRAAVTTRLAGELAAANRQLTGEIADRERAEAIMRESERRHRLFAENVTDVIWTMDFTGRYTYLSPSIKEAMGYTPEEGMQMTIDEMLTPASAAECRKNLAQLRAAVDAGIAGKPAMVEIEKVRKDGSTGWGEVTLSPMYDESGKCVAVQGVTRDITKRKEAEQAQAQSLRRLEWVNRLQEELLLPGSLTDKLKKITDVAIELVDLDVCKVWAIRPSDRCDGCLHAQTVDDDHRCASRARCLHLLAGSGLCIGRPGDYDRVPLGRYVVGEIATGQEKKYLTNEVVTNPKIYNRQWAKENGLVAFAGYKLRDSDGEATGVFAVLAKHPVSAIDDAFLSSLAEITARVILEDMAAESLRASERRHRLFAENVPDVIWTMDLFGRLTYMSPSVEKVLGYPWDDKAPWDLAQLVVPSQLPRVKRLIDSNVAAAKSGHRIPGGSMEVELIRKDGSVIWSETSYSGIYDEHGEIVGTQGITRDISERKQMDIALRESEHQAQAILNQSLHFAGILTPDGIVKKVNRTALELPGTTEASVINKPFWKCPWWTHSPELQKILQEALPRAARGEVIRMDVTHPAADGSLHWFDFSIVPVKNEAGDVIWLIPEGRDVTEHKRLEDELRRAKEAAEAATEAKSRFLANMSHEIRTPMTAILGYAELLTDSTISESSRNNFLAVIRRNGEYLLGLINDILDLSKVEAGKLTIESRWCNVVALAADVASVVRPRALQRGLSLALDYVGELPETILTDEVRLRQALVNLVGNAVKFTEHGGVRIKVEFLKAWRDGRPAVRFDVIDSGIGVQPDVLSQLFQPFVQADSSVSRRFGGSGLGLAISRHIVELLGGQLTATSVWGEGSTFTITVPTGNLDGIAMIANPGEIQEQTAADAVSLTDKVLSGVRILLAEDGYDNRELIQIVLRSVGATVETVENGQEAVNRLMAEQFDIVLMDMNMPVLDGYEATRILRDRGYEKPILALTASVLVSDTDRCLAVGCNEHLTKPIDRVRLIGCIASYAGKELAAQPPAAPASAPQGRPIVSQLLDDPEVAGILGGFVGRLAGYVDAMRQAYADKRYEDLQRQAHQLKGAGGCYGYPSLTDACKALEEAAKRRDPAMASELLEVVANLSQLIQQGYEIPVSAGETR